MCLRRGTDEALGSGRRTLSPGRRGRAPGTRSGAEEDAYSSTPSTRTGVSSPDSRITGRPVVTGTPSSEGGQRVVSDVMFMYLVLQSCFRFKLKEESRQ